MGGVGVTEQAGFLGQKRVDPVAGHDHPGPQLGTLAVGAHADHPTAAVAHQAGGHRGGEQPGPGVGGLARQPRVELGPQSGHAVERRRPPRLGSEVDRQRLGSGHHHGRPADHPPLDRHLVPPFGDDAVENPSVDHPAVDVLRPGERSPLHQYHRATGPGQGQGRGRPGRTGSHHDCVEVSASAASVDGPTGWPAQTAPELRSADRPGRSAGAGSAPVHPESTGQLGQQCPGVGDQSQVGHGSHRAEGIGIDADDVPGGPQTAHVLGGPRYAQGDVQLGIDGDAGGADLALIAGPAGVGGHPGGAGRCPHRRRHLAPASRRPRWPVIAAPDHQAGPSPHHPTGVGQVDGVQVRFEDRRSPRHRATGRPPDRTRRVRVGQRLDDGSTSDGATAAAPRTRVTTAGPSPPPASGPDRPAGSRWRSPGIRHPVRDSDGTRRR